MHSVIVLKKSSGDIMAYFVGDIIITTYIDV